MCRYGILAAILLAACAPRFARRNRRAARRLPDRGCDDRRRRRRRGRRRRGKSLRGRSGRRDPRRRRLGRRRRGRDAGDARPGRAPELGNRRRRVPALLRRLNRTVTAFDGREAAPSGALPGMFLDPRASPSRTTTPSYRDARPACQAQSRCSAARMRGTELCLGEAVRAGDPRCAGRRPVPKRMGRFVNDEAGRRRSRTCVRSSRVPTAPLCRRATRTGIPHTRDTCA